MARSLDGDRRGPGSTEGLPPDARRRDRRAGRPADPDRRPVALRLRVVQLPRLRPRPRDRRCRPRVPRRVGHPPVVVPTPREPGAVRGDRGQGDGARRGRGHAAVPDDHTHPHVGHPDPRGRRHGLPRRTGAQDDLRRRDDRARPRRDRSTLPPRRPRPSRRAAAVERDHASRDRARRRQLDARERARSARVRPSGARIRRAPLRRRRPRVRGRRRACDRRAQPVGQARQRHHPPPGRDLRERDLRRRVLQGVLVAARVPDPADAAQGRAEGRGASLPVLRDPRRSPPSRRRSWGST